MLEMWFGATNSEFLGVRWLHLDILLRESFAFEVKLIVPKVIFEIRSSLEIKEALRAFLRLDQLNFLAKFGIT